MDVDVGTRAILKLAVLPPGSLLILLLVGWLFARRFFGRLLLLLGIVSFYALATPVGTSLLASRLETVPALNQDQIGDARADAILVFLAGVRRNNPELGGADSLGARSLQRMDYALSLHRQTGLPIVLSGGSVSGETRPIARLGAEWLQQRAGVTALAVEDRSRDTYENAHYSAALLQAEGVQRVLLVTHASHMPRALWSTRSAGIETVPAPFAFQHKPLDPPAPLEPSDWVPHPGNLGRSYVLLHEMAGLVWYGLRQAERSFPDPSDRRTLSGTAAIGGHHDLSARPG